MQQYLKADAIERIWASVAKDYNSIIKPARLSSKSGTVGSQRVLWQNIPLPDSIPSYRGGDFFHIFQIGNTEPKLLSTLKLDYAWIYSPWHNVEDLINDTGVLIEVYVQSGRVIPRFDCYLRYDRFNNLILAIRDRERFEELRQESVYIRFLANSYFHSRFNESSYQLRVKAKKIEQSSDIASQRSLVRNYRNRDVGECMIFVDGVYYSYIDYDYISTGQIVEVLYDPSVRRVESKDLSSLKTFYSNRDERSKYIFKPTAFKDDRIELIQNADVFLIEPRDDHQVGVMVSQNQAYNFRMLTHQDFSVDIDTVHKLRDRHREDGIFEDDAKLLIFTRESGQPKYLTLTDNRIHELYKLDSEDIETVIGPDQPSLERFLAYNLESNPYVKIIEAQRADFDYIDVENAYGYNATALTLGRSYQRRKEDDSVAIPPAYRNHSTAFEYDQDGYLVDFRVIQAHDQYTPSQKGTRSVEFLSGELANGLDVQYIDFREQNTNEFEIDPRFNYRVYQSTLIDDTPTWDWEDITDNCQIEDDTLTVDVEPGEYQYVAIVSDRNILVYEQKIEPSNGVYIAYISDEQKHPEHIDISQVDGFLHIPVYSIDLFLNGRALIEGIDYLHDGHRFIITNKSYLDQSKDEQDVIVRVHGLDDGQFNQSVREHGFVENGRLGFQSQYKVRDDINALYFIDGRITDPDEIEFAYTYQGQDDRFDNGRPYMARENIVNLGNGLYHKTYPWRKRSREIDQEVAEFISTFEEIEPFPQPQYVERLHRLYSPFCARLIQALKTDQINRRHIEKRYYVADDIRQIVDTYLDYLDFDPAKQGYDRNHVSVHPHPYNYTLELDIYQYLFLKDALDLLIGEDQVDLSEFVQVVVPGKGEVERENIVGA